MNKFLLLLPVFLFALVTMSRGQDHWQPTSQQEVPPRPNRLVDDLADMLSRNEENQLEQKLWQKATALPFKLPFSPSKI
jgi:hypothetical protein